MAEEKESLLLGRFKKPFEVKDLPRFPGYAAMIGPGIIWAGLAQGSGELIWWPYVVAKYGLFFLSWLIFYASLQYWVNLEIARYTMATGETIFEGFHRVHRIFGWVTFIMCLIVLLWIGGYVSGGATALAALTKFPPGWDAAGQTRFWAEVTIILIWILFVLGPVAYKVVEWAETAAAMISFFGMLTAVLLSPAVAKVAGEFFPALVPWYASGFSMLPANFDPADMNIFITLIAYTGMGGFWNLLYSFWVRDKNAAMAAHIGRVTSPVTGKPEPIPGVGVAFRDTEEVRKSWREWMSWQWVENLIGVVLNTLTIVLATLLTYAVLRPEYLATGKLPSGWKLVVYQAEWLGHVWGDVGRGILYLVGFFFLADSYIGALDGAGRMVASNLYTLPKVPERVEYRKIYYYTVTIFTVIGMITVLVEQPGPLLLATGVTNMLIMVLFTWVFFYQNFYLLPRIHPAGKVVRPSWIVFVFLLISAIFFTYSFILYLGVTFKLW
ncbi:MAG: Nramp family divalent metal transporter [Candidatus Korarchaeum sp.]